MKNTHDCLICEDGYLVYLSNSDWYYCPGCGAEFSSILVEGKDLNDTKSK